MSKTILITGSTDGIGKLAAVKLAKDGHHIVLHGRNEQKLHRIIREIKEASENDNIEGFVADFSSMKAVGEMVKEIGSKFSKIDVLINNAGIYKSPIDKTEEGLDIRFAVNFFAPYILTNGLLPILNQGENSRIINLSSAAQSTVRKGTLNGQATVNASESYAQSKLALTMWSFYLATQVENINVIAVNPGSLLNTRMVAEAFGQHWSSADKGANILYDLAINESYHNDSGKYFDNDKGHFAKANSDAYDDRLIQELIGKTESIIK